MNYTEILEKVHLFKGIRSEEIENILGCLQAEYREYGKDSIVISEGDSVTKVGVILSGRARSIKTDIHGNSVIIMLLEEGGYIGALLAASHGRRSPVTVQASGRLSVLFFPIERILDVCDRSCPFHKRMLSNLFDGIAEKALILHDRNSCLIKTTVREKVLAYLTRLSQESGTDSFNIPLDRNGLAEYLNVDRSALSRELSNMKNDGLIDYYKNSFQLIQ